MNWNKAHLTMSAFGMVAVLAACTQGTPENQQATEETTEEAPNEVTEAAVSASATDETPEPFASGNVEVAVVRQLSTGDVYQDWIAGVQAEAEELGIELTVYNADGDNAQQALDLEQAVASDPDGILLGWGFGESLEPGIEAAAEADIPMASYYVNTEPSDNLLTLKIDDAEMMDSVLADMLEHTGDEAEILYNYVPGFQALDNRNVTFEEFLEDNPGITVAATAGEASSNTVAATADQTRSALSANPDISAIVAPWNAFAKGATLAVQELGLEDSVKVYGIDISTSDIEVMREPNSPWVITGAADHVNLGEVSMRGMALKIAEQVDGNSVSIPPAIITSDELNEHDISNMDQLIDDFPDLSTPDLMRAPWMNTNE